MATHCTSQGWKVIQSRGQFGNPEDYFWRTWAEYKEPFGEPGREFWIGLENMHGLTKNTDYWLRVRLTGADGTTAVAYYNLFRVAGEV